MPLVTVAMYEGRSLDQKRELVRGLTEVVARVTGNPLDAVHVIIEDVKRENWGIGGLIGVDRQRAPAVAPPAPSAPTRPVKLPAAAVPPVELSRGMQTRYTVCQETVGTQTLRMGVCSHAADMAPMKWKGRTEEGFYVARGSIKVTWEAAGGERGEVVAREGEQVYLPPGLDYALEATGEPALNVFAIAGGSTSVGAVVGPEAGEQLKAAAARLR